MLVGEVFPAHIVGRSKDVVVDKVQEADRGHDGGLGEVVPGTNLKICVGMEKENRQQEIKLGT